MVPPGHTSAHVRDIGTQLGVAPPHAIPHPAQLALVPSCVSHPLLATPSQSAKPFSQGPTAHRPALQRATVCGKTQGILQPPQCVALLAVSTQSAPQRICPAAQPEPHMPVVGLQSGVGSTHARPHAPQLREVFKGVSQPSSARMLQSAKPVSQGPCTHSAKTQLAEACAKLHVRSQRPQCAGSVKIALQALPHKISPGLQARTSIRVTSPGPPSRGLAWGKTQPIIEALPSSNSTTVSAAAGKAVIRLVERFTTSLIGVYVVLC